MSSLDLSGQGGSLAALPPSPSAPSLSAPLLSAQQRGQLASPSGTGPGDAKTLSDAGVYGDAGAHGVVGAAGGYNGVGKPSSAPEVPDWAQRLPVHTEANVDAAFIPGRFFGEVTAQGSLAARDGQASPELAANEITSQDADTNVGTAVEADVRAVERGTSRVNPRSVAEHVAERRLDPGEFWARVVTAQNALQEHPQCPPGQALSMAIAWAVAASGTTPESVARPAAAVRAPLGNAGTPRPATAASPSGAAQATGESQAVPELPEWVNQLHAELSTRAERALVAAWEQRGSALRAATHGKG